MVFRFGLLLVLGLSALFALSSQYDVEKMSPVGDTHPNKDSRIRCKSDPAFALAGALEVAYNKATGERKAYSVQEVVDCFHKGCEKSRLEEIVDWLIVNDRLAHKDKYTDYKAKVFTCRAGTSPDGLVGFKVTGMTKITPDDFEAEIQRRGVVMACVDTTKGGCPSYDDGYRGGVIAGNSTRSYYHCMENVLITGFDDDSYRVRTSRGSSFGEAGYARIARGNNACGIEQSMTVLETESRRSKAEVNVRTSCPAAFPKFCQKTRTCKTSSQRCSPEIKQSSSASQYRPTGNSGAKPGPVYRPSAGTKPGPGNRPSGGSSGSYGGYDFGHVMNKRESVDRCADTPGFNCPLMTSTHCKIDRIREKCGESCGVCDDESSSGCQDDESTPGQCASFKKYCDTIPGIRVKCAKTCGVDSSDCAESLRPVVPEGNEEVKPPPMGMCSPPRIANGRVLNGGGRGMINPGDVLRVSCNRGYTLIGEPSKCEIQNVFSPDTRRLQECVRLGEERFEGNGAEYTGRQNQVVSNRVCDNWLKLAHTGLFRGLDRGLTLAKGGNHNFCRNVGGEDFSPFCYTNDGQLKEYCFEMPKCGGRDSDKCNGVHADVYDNCAQYDEWSCELEDERSIARTEWYWTNCAAMCCEYAGCQ